MDSLVQLVEVEGDIKGKLRAFTLVELIVVVGIVSTLSAIAYFSLGRLQTSTDSMSSIDRLTSTIRTQRMYAMLGNSVLKTSAMPQGIYFSQGKNTFVLFSCISSTNCIYDPESNLNIEEQLENTQIFTTVNLPNNQIIFSPLSGEVMGYDQNKNSITVSSVANNSHATIVISSMGTIIEE